MKNETNFYDIIGSKFNERETPYDDANWKQMRAMIDASRAAKKRALWLVAASVGLLLCAGGGIALYTMNNNSGKTNTVANNTPAMNNITKPNTISASTNQVTNSTAPAVQSTGANNNATSINSNSNIQNGAAVSNNRPSVNTPSVAAANTIPFVLNQKSIKHNRHMAKSANPSIASTNNVASDNNVGDNNTQGTKQDNTLNNKITSANSTPSVTKTTPAVKAPVTASVNNKTAVHKMDSAAAGDALPPRWSDEPRVFDGKTSIFSVEAGAEYDGGWQIGSVVQAQGFNPMVGVNYARYMGSKIFLKVGLQFLDFGHMSPLTYNYQHSIGNVIYDSVITTQNLYFLRLPIQAEYFVGRKKKSSFGLGGAVWYLLGNSGYATTYQQLDNNPPVNMIKYSGNAPLSGYNKVDASAHILYRYTINRHLSFCGLVYFELTGMKDNAFFGENIIQRTRGFQFTGAYSF